VGIDSIGRPMFENVLIEEKKCLIPGFGNLANIDLMIVSAKKVIGIYAIHSLWNDDSVTKYR
jgi:hypothetical protein